MPPTLRSNRATAALDSYLTPAEQQVCELLLTGLFNKEITNELNCADVTIKNRSASIMCEHGVPSRARLLAHHRQRRWACRGEAAQFSSNCLNGRA